MNMNMQACLLMCVTCINIFFCKIILVLNRNIAVSAVNNCINHSHMVATFQEEEELIQLLCCLFPTVETSQAGPGNLEVTVNGGRVPTSAQAQGPHTYAISFTPREAIAHTVDLRFNGEDVPGKVFSIS